MKEKNKEIIQENKARLKRITLHGAIEKTTILK